LKPHSIRHEEGLGVLPVAFSTMVDPKRERAGVRGGKGGGKIGKRPSMTQHHRERDI